MRWWSVSLRHGDAVIVFRVQAVSSESALVVVSRWPAMRSYSVVSVRDEGLVAA